MEEEPKGATIADHVLDIARGGDSIAISLIVSIFLFNKIKEQPNQLEIALLTAGIFAFYIVLHIYVVKSMPNLPWLKGNPQWMNVIKKYMLTVFRVGAYFLVQYFLELFIVRWAGSSDTSVEEMVVGVFSIILIGITGIEILETVLKPPNES